MLTLGCMSFDNAMTFGYQEEKDSIDTIKEAVKLGINFFDTAEMYGDGVTEEILGKAVADCKNSVVIASKFNPPHNGYDDVITACENSLKRLNRDYLDLYQIHWPNDDIPIEDTMLALLKLQEQGKIREIGVCNFGKIDISKVLGYNVIATNQMPYNLFMRGIEFEILPLMIENGVGLLTYSSLAQGLLSGKYKTADEFPQSRARTRIFSTEREFASHGEPGCEGDVFEALAKIEVIAAEVGCPMSDLAIAWLLSQPGMTSVIAGGRTPAQVTENAKGAEVTLSADVVKALNDATDKVKQYIGTNPDPWNTRIK